jgi:hypothetical protein
MPYHTFQHYIFSTNLPSESSSQNDPKFILRNLQSQLQSCQIASLPSVFSVLTFSLLVTPWIPSTKILKLLDNFNSSILNQFLCAPCAFCGCLIYLQKCEWLSYDNNYLYPFLKAYPKCQPASILTFHIKAPKCITICSSCKNLNTKYAFPFLHSIPNEI